MEIIVGGELVNERAIEMGSELKKLFDKAKLDQRSVLFASFAVIAAHLATQKRISELFAAVRMDGPSEELAPFFNGGDLSEDAKAALNLLAKIDNTDPDSWGSFMEFSHESYN